MAEIKRWLLIQEFDATAEMAQKIRETLYATGVNTKRDGFHLKRVDLNEVIYCGLAGSQSCPACDPTNGLCKMESYCNWKMPQPPKQARRFH